MTALESSLADVRGPTWAPRVLSGASECECPWSWWLSLRGQTDSERIFRTGLAAKWSTPVRFLMSPHRIEPMIDPPDRE
jgi:hypothetical protein